MTKSHSRLRRIWRFSLAGFAVLALSTATTAVHAQGKPARRPPPPMSGVPLMGTIHSASRSTLSLALAPSKKVVTVHLTGSTRYLVNGKTSSKAPAWKKGERVQVIAAKGKDGSFTARAIMVGMPSLPPPGQGNPGPPPPGTNG